ncbi:hypothetical protein [Microbacterium sp. A94]|uniref:hypothetical protein n=1 Tax=Microbacterium sp. A94 TaxID=3450717 RepID=UPI003F43DCB6
MSDEFEVVSGTGRVRVKGLRKTLRSMEQAGADAESMRDLMHSIGSIVVRSASPPRVSGALAGTMRAGRGKTKAVVRAGGARAPYGPVIHYGWPARGISAQPFLSDALNRNQANIFRELDTGIADILSHNRLT